MSKNTKRKDGLYRYWYKGRQFYGATDAEARRKRDDYKYECEHGIEQVKPVTVFDLASSWLPVAKASVAANTYNQYASVMEKLTAVIGDKLVSAVTPGDIKKVWASFTGQSQSMISKGHFLYKSFFQHAVENGFCRQNPMLAESAKPHSGTRGSHRALEPWEISLIESTPHRCRPAAMFMLKAGLRRGEVLALRKRNIRNGRICVTDAVKFIKNRPVVGGTKNESSVRYIPLFDVLKPVADEVSDYVLPSSSGRVCSESAFDRAWESYLTDLETALNGCHKRWWHLTAEWKAEHPDEYAKYLKLKADKKETEAEEFRLRGWQSVDIRPHDLRHTFVTSCRDRGVDLHVCMRWCGHSSEKMILQIYDHISREREQNAVSLFNLQDRDPAQSPQYPQFGT